MADFLTFLDMGGYAFYVWSAYAVFVVVLAANVGLTVLRGREVRRRLVRELRYGGNER